MARTGRRLDGRTVALFLRDPSLAHVISSVRLCGNPAVRPPSSSHGWRACVARSRDRGGAGIAWLPLVWTRLGHAAPSVGSYEERNGREHGLSTSGGPARCERNA